LVVFVVFLGGGGGLSMGGKNGFSLAWLDVDWKEKRCDDDTRASHLISRDGCAKKERI